MQAKAQARRILVVDDNRDVVLTMMWLLRERGHEVAFALNGDSALEVARRFRPEIIFLDLVLPDADGCDLARELRREPGLEGVRILALTAYGGDADRFRSLEAGCERHFVKPLDPRVLDSPLAQR